MNGPDHYREAERLLAEATTRGDFNPRAQWCLELAKLHTALAHVAATALTSDGREWAEVAGRRFCDMTLVLQSGPGPEFAGAAGPHPPCGRTHESLERQMGSCSGEPPRGNQDLGRSQDAHHDSMSPCRTG